jgi:hypothetical protein
MKNATCCCFAVVLIWVAMLIADESPVMLLQTETVAEDFQRELEKLADADAAADYLKTTLVKLKKLFQLGLNFLPDFMENFLFELFYNLERKIWSLQAELYPVIRTLFVV